MEFRYKPIVQKPYCCVPACISMILDRRKIKHGSQEEIGYQLGLIVPKEKAYLFKKVMAGKKPAAGYGTQVQKKSYSVNNYFRKNKINLRETYYPPEKVMDCKKFISENLRKGNDVIVCFNNRKLYGVGDYGHVSLVKEVDARAATLVDPAENAPKKRKVKLTDLAKAIKCHGKQNRAGFWVIQLDAD